MRTLFSNSRVTRVTAIAVSVAATLAAGNAVAAQKYYGGGSTFVAPVYVGADYLNFNPEARLSTQAGNNAGVGFTTAGISAGSEFDVFKTSSNNQNLVSYCQTGSGFGKNSLNGAASAPANGSCNDYSTSPAGLSAPTASPDFIGTDAPYSTTDYNAFLTGPQLATKGGIVQVPTLAGAEALAHGDSIDNVKLTNAQVCRIYSGMITNWKSIAGVTGAGNKGPITIVYRTDGSGTTFAFTRYLAATCNGTTNVPAGFVFSPNQTFNSAIPGGVTAVYGTRAVGASGNPGVVGATLDPSNPNALGYADVGEVILEAAGYALVNGYDPTQFGLDPTSGLPAPLKITVANLLTGKVLDGATANDVPGSSSQTIKNCVRLVNPALKLTNTYPIVAFTYLGGYYSGNGVTAHVNGIRKLFNQFYVDGTRPALPQGYAYLDGYLGFGTQVKTTVNACINP